MSRCALPLGPGRNTGLRAAAQEEEVKLQGLTEQMDHISINLFFFSGTPTSLPPLPADPLRMDSSLI